ncbi:hypothetical protein JOM56_007135 [Amanita muscaria]
MLAAGLSLSSFNKKFIDRALKVVFWNMTASRSRQTSLKPEFQVQQNRLEAHSLTSTSSADEQTTDGSSYTPSPSAESFKPWLAADAPVTTKILVDTRLTHGIDEHLRSPRPLKEVTGEAYRMLSDTQPCGRLPTPFAVGQIIQTLGCAGGINKVQKVYDIDQKALSVGPKS